MQLFCEIRSGSKTIDELTADERSTFETFLQDQDDILLQAKVLINQGPPKSFFGEYHASKDDPNINGKAWVISSLLLAHAQMEADLGFVVRRLERSYGQPMVKRAYERMRREQPERLRGRRRVTPGVD